MTISAGFEEQFSVHGQRLGMIRYSNAAVRLCHLGVDASSDWMVSPVALLRCNGDCHDNRFPKRDSNARILASVDPLDIKAAFSITGAELLRAAITAPCGFDLRRTACRETGRRGAGRNPHCGF